MEFALITDKKEFEVKRIIRFRFPLVTVLECKSWKGGMAFKISGGMTNCVMLCKYLLTSCMDVSEYTNEEKLDFYTRKRTHA